MTWTYTPDFTTQRDRIRLLLGDTDSADPILTDEEIAVYSTGGYWAQSSDHLAAAALADNIAAEFARRADSLSAGGTSVNWSGLVDRYRSLAAKLRGRGGAAIYAGGISQSDKDSQAANTDRVEPAFTRISYPYEDPLTGEERQYRGV